MIGPVAGGPQARLRRPEHQAVLCVLEAMDARLLADCRCWFGGGPAIVLAITARADGSEPIVLALGEYRLSRDVGSSAPTMPVTASYAPEPSTRARTACSRRQSRKSVPSARTATAYAPWFRPTACRSASRSSA